MVFTIYFTLTWLIVYLLLASKDKHLLEPSVFLFLISCLIHAHIYILIPENFKGFDISNEVQQYLSFLLYKTILVPGCLVLFFLLFKQKQKVIFLYVSSLFYALSMAALDFIGEFLSMYTYKWWNSIYAFFYYSILSILSLILLKLFLKLKEATT